MRAFEKTLNDIKSVKIQGAESIAKAAVEAFYQYSKNLKLRDRKKFLKEIENARRRLLSTRPTEPLMRNCLNYIFENLKSKNVVDLKTNIKKSVEKIFDHFEFSERKIAEIGSRKIENGMIIFTHCHSTTVMNILKMAKSKGKKFEVYNTETRPLFQGRKTAYEISKIGVKVTHFIDSAARIALKKSDVFLMGADAINSEGKIINKIGSELFAEVAERYDIPVYVCTNSWKFDSKSIFGYKMPIEIRSPKEIWDKPPKNVKVMNFAFERVDPKLITAIISELGIYPPEIFIEEVKKAYSWLG